MTSQIDYYFNIITVPCNSYSYYYYAHFTDGHKWGKEQLFVQSYRYRVSSTDGILTQDIHIQKLAS